ncbi:hypothetical protein [Roseibium suaedae]|uniref:hypothetical protein n=1 Tax=Roseibium suaedae TaxID=735517 RepID=UPI001587FFF9|nr:hypothetical protein [Roseibium suaedae]
MGHNDAGKTNVIAKGEKDHCQAGADRDEIDPEKTPVALAGVKNAPNRTGGHTCKTTEKDKVSRPGILDPSFRPARQIVSPEKLLNSPCYNHNSVFTPPSALSFFAGKYMTLKTLPNGNWQGVSKIKQ